MVCKHLVNKLVSQVLLGAVKHLGNILTNPKQKKN